MATQTHFEPQPTNGLNSLDNYPVPLSPPLPLVSKDVELNRALTASSRSALFSLSHNDVIFEDEWLIAVNKPQGVYCESVLSAVPNLLADSNNEHGTKAPELHLANRLDRDTSGVMVITKSHKVAAKLVKAFTEHKVRKTYLALCVGPAPKWGQIIVRSGHGRSKHGAWRVYAASDVGRTLPGGSVVKDMQTSFQALSINGFGCLEAVSESGKEGGGDLLIVEEKSVKAVHHLKVHESIYRMVSRNQVNRYHPFGLLRNYLTNPLIFTLFYSLYIEKKLGDFSSYDVRTESLSSIHISNDFDDIFISSLNCVSIRVTLQWLR
nr:RNA pseudouridine synthase 1 [Ipomoea batatas]